MLAVQRRHRRAALPVRKALGADALVHLAVQEDRLGMSPPGSAQVCLTGRTGPRQTAAMEHHAAGHALGGVGGGVEAAPLVHEQGAAFKPAAVWAEDEVNVPLDVTVLEVLPPRHRGAIAYAGHTLGDQPGQRVPGHLGHGGAAEERVLGGDHAAVAPHAPVARSIHRHRLAHLPAIPRVVADGQVLHLHVAARHQQGGGQEGAPGLALRVQIPGAALGGQDRAVPGLAHNAQVILVDDDPLMVFVHAYQQDHRRTVAEGHRVHRRLNGGKVPRAVPGNDVHAFPSFRSAAFPAGRRPPCGRRAPHPRIGYARCPAARRDSPGISPARRSCTGSGWPRRPCR